MGHPENQRPKPGPPAEILAYRRLGYFIRGAVKIAPLYRVDVESALLIQW